MKLINQADLTCFDGDITATFSDVCNMIAEIVQAQSYLFRFPLDHGNCNVILKKKKKLQRNNLLLFVMRYSH